MSRLLTRTLLAAAVLATTSTANAAASPGHARTAIHHIHVNPHATVAASAPVDSRNPVTAAAAIAQRYWGAVPCGGRVAVVADSVLAAGLDPTTDAWVTFRSSLGPNDLDAPAQSYSDCTISLARWQWASWTDMESDWGMYCLTVIHEMGHLLGYRHSATPGSVMAPVFTSDANVPAICNATWLRGWRSEGAAHPLPHRRPAGHR